MSIQVLIFFAILIFYVLRFISTQRKQQEEARKRQNQGPTSTPPETTDVPQPPGDKPQPKTIEEILREMHRRVETQNKPYAKPVTQRQRTTPVKEVPRQQPKIQEKKEPAPFLTEEYSRYEEKKEPTPILAREYSGNKGKKQPTPFLTEEYSAYKIEEAKVPENMSADFIRQGELTDVYNLPQKKSSVTNFNARDAVIASIILNRLEW